jgi:hypothetical protein
VPINYTLRPGALSTWFDGWNNPIERRHVMDLDAHPFAGPIVDHEAFVRRYGFDRRVNGQARFGVDAETILGAGSRWLEETFGAIPTLEELHDYAATNPYWRPVQVPPRRPPVDPLPPRDPDPTPEPPVPTVEFVPVERLHTDAYRFLEWLAVQRGVVLIGNGRARQIQRILEYVDYVQAEGFVEEP